MQTVTTIGLDIAKSVFQVHGVDAAGQVVIRRQLKRQSVLAFFQKLPSCLVGIEACASSHHWSRELQALGHTVRLMPPAYDMADAEAICEAVARANMRFVPTKTPEQQSCLMLHRTRHLFIRQQTAVINSIRAHLAEFGIVAPVGRKGVTELPHIVADPSDKRVPEVARARLAGMRVFGRDLIRGGHYGQRSCEPHLKAEHMAAPTNPAKREESSCQSGAVHTWHKTVMSNISPFLG
jgi:transposase